MKPKPKPSKIVKGKPMPMKKVAPKKSGKSMGTCPVCKGRTVNGVCQRCGATYD